MREIDYRLAKFVERLYDVRCIGINSIANELNMSYTAIMSKLMQLYSQGFSFRGFIDIRKLKLREVAVISKYDVAISTEVPFLRSYVNLIPQGSYLTFYVPDLGDEENSRKFLSKILTKLGITQQEVDFIVTRELKRVSLIRYRWPLDSVARANDPSEWLKIIDDYEEAFKKYETVVSIPHVRAIRVRKSSSERLRLDSQCLRVLKEVERGPLRRLKDISCSAKVNFRKVMKCVKTFIDRGIFCGLRIAKTPWGKLTDLYAVALIKTSHISEALALMESSVRFPLSAGSMVGEKGRIYIAFRIKSSNLAAFKRFLQRIEQMLGFDVVWMGIGPIHMSGAFTVPYKQGFEYSKYKKGWLTDI